MLIEEGGLDIQKLYGDLTALDRSLDHIKNGRTLAQFANIPVFSGDRGWRLWFDRDCQVRPGLPPSTSKKPLARRTRR